MSIRYVMFPCVDSMYNITSMVPRLLKSDTYVNSVQKLKNDHLGNFFHSYFIWLNTVKIEFLLAI